MRRQSRSFKSLALRGKWRLGDPAKLVHVSAVKTGGSQAPANLVKRNN